MKDRIFLTVGVLALIGLIVLSGCVPKATEREETGPIKIGVIATMAWPVGKSAAQAVELAVDKINAEGGLLGRKLELIQEDSRGQVPIAVERYRKLAVNDRASLIVVAEGGTITIACQEAGADIFPEYPHIMASGGASAEAISKNIRENYGRFRFVINPYIAAHDRFVSAVLMNVRMIKATGAKKVAILGEDIPDYAPYWQGWPEYGFRPYPDVAYRDLGIQVVYTAKIAVGEKMFLPIFEKIAASGAEYIDFCMSAYSDFYILAKQWEASAARDIPIFHSGVSPKYWETTGGACLGMIGWWPSDHLDYEVVGKTREYLKAFYEKYGYSGSNWLAQQSYDDVVLFAEAVKKARTLEVDKLLKTLVEIEVDGVRGKIKLNPKDNTAHATPPFPSGYPERIAKAALETPDEEVTRVLTEINKEYLKDFPTTFVYPYAPVAPFSQWQDNGKLIILYPYEVVQKTNPGQGYVSPKELRGRAGQ